MLKSTLALVLGLSAAVCVLPGGASHAQEKDKDKKATFEVYKDKGGEFRWRLRAGNGKILAVPEDAYKTLAAAKEAVENVKTNAGTWKVEYTMDKGKKHRWDMKARNGRVMARSSEGYESKAAAEKSVETFRADAKGATINEVK